MVGAVHPLHDLTAESYRVYGTVDMGHDPEDVLFLNVLGILILGHPLGCPRKLGSMASKWFVTYL